MCSSLRVVRHPRGHVAGCNGRVELLSAKVEQCREREEDAVKMATLEETRGREERERREKRLRSFQREVRERVKRREKRRQIQVTAIAEEAAQSEQRVVQRAVGLQPQGREPLGLPRLPSGADVDDAAITGRRVGTGGQEGGPSASQLARRTLLAQMYGAGGHPIPDGSGPQREEKRPEMHREVSQCAVSMDGGSSVKDGGDSGMSASKIRFTPAGRREEAEKKRAQEQYLLFRRLYSDLEREQVRQRRQRRSQNEYVHHLKKAKEVGRRAMEEEMTAMDSFTSTVSTEAAEEEQRAQEWAETVALEERRNQMQRVKENERYIDALRGTLRERLSQQQAEVPPLCSCATSVWDSGPKTCANNCVFYRNPRGYAKTLSKLLSTLGK